MASSRKEAEAYHQKQPLCCVAGFSSCKVSESVFKGGHTIM